MTDLHCKCGRAYPRFAAEPAPVPPVAAVMDELRDAAMEAVEKWVIEEHHQTKIMGAGGPYSEKRLNKAEAKARAAIDALAQARAAQSAPVPTTTKESQ